MKIVITCEHGGNEIPPRFNVLFKNSAARLQSHEGYDIGALKLAYAFAETFPDYFFYSKVSRLLVELNRSKHHPKLFSDLMSTLKENEKKEVLKEYYDSYRNLVYNCIAQLIENHNQLLHLSIHSFTPVFNDVERNTAIGLLYDPKRLLEKNLCVLWKKEIYAISKEYKVRFNYPYFGKSDGFITFLRKQFSAASYIGIEVEVNQKLLTAESYPKLENILLSSIKKIVNNWSLLELNNIPSGI